VVVVEDPVPARVPVQVVPVLALVVVVNDIDKQLT
jgi:hypothetical protein